MSTTIDALLRERGLTEMPKDKKHRREIMKEHAIMRIKEIRSKRGK